MPGIVRKLVRVPRQDPFVMHGVSRVVARPPAWGRGERPRVNDGEQDEERETGDWKRQTVSHREPPDLILIM
jgi:hypothetical protein